MPVKLTSGDGNPHRITNAINKNADELATKLGSEQATTVTILTEAEYAALTPKDANTIYLTTA